MFSLRFNNFSCSLKEFPQIIVMVFHCYFLGVTMSHNENIIHDQSGRISSNSVLMELPRDYVGFCRYLYATKGVQKVVFMLLRSSRLIWKNLFLHQGRRTPVPWLAEAESLPMLVSHFWTLSLCSDLYGLNRFSICQLSFNDYAASSVTMLMVFVNALKKVSACKAYTYV